MSRTSSGMATFLGAACVGIAGGWLLARRHDRSHRHDLFSPRAYRRYAALGFIASEADPELLPLLQDYLAWEPVRALRERACRIIDLLGAAA
ncbi:MAG TPA: hypothetical protein VGM77_00035 [Gemmatimonadales bacterium]